MSDTLCDVAMQWRCYDFVCVCILMLIACTIYLPEVGPHLQVQSFLEGVLPFFLYICGTHVNLIDSVQ